MPRSFDRCQIDQKLQTIETDLEQFKVRYQAFLANWDRYTALQEQIGEEQDRCSPEASLALEDPQAIQQESDRLHQEILELDALFESQFFSWSGFGTVFWQAVRFLGGGLVLGWLLRGCTGG